MTAARRFQPRSWAFALVVALGLSAGACSRAHITPTHGRAFHEVFAIQDANPTRGDKAKSLSGLDSQEAAIIASSYRKALAPKDSGGAAAPQLLMVSPNAGGGSSAVVAPSVPAGN
jgi:hypothetical protein